MGECCVGFSILSSVMSYNDNMCTCPKKKKKPLFYKPFSILISLTEGGLGNELFYL